MIERPPRRKCFAFAILVDVAPRFYVQALVFYWTLKAYLNVPEGDIFIHYVSGAAEDVISYLAGKGVVTIEVSIWHTLSPPCNKLRMFENPLLADYEYVIFSDCDKVYYPPILTHLSGDSIKACRFVARPPFYVFERVYAELNRELRQVVIRGIPYDSPVQDGRTPYNNMNGGTYIIPGKRISELYNIWSFHVDWLIDNDELMGEWTRNIDQVALCLAMDQCHEEIELLPKSFDLGLGALNIGNIKGGDAPEIGAIHYHARMTDEGQLWPKPGCHPALVEKVAEINGLITQNSEKEFPNYRNYAEECRGLWL